ncbi:MAG: DUF2442 domain-containing protein [Deltaproteobacteria bacterium]|nr:DUF2442 domain-containing protein [Deltaproteobacteria bacterium]
MNLAVRKNNPYPAILKVKVSKEKISSLMSDGREVSIPTAWFARLASASLKQLENFEISPGGYGIHWPDIDEDISVKAFFD